jgi:iron complex transport system substrate-binding protein
VNRRNLLHVVALLLGALLSNCSRSSPSAKEHGSPARIVSLSPAITETLFAIGAGTSLVAVSDYSDYPDAARQLPHVGTSLTPSYEAIARLAPTLIMTESAVNTAKSELSALGPAEFLPWLSVDQIVASTRRIGALTEHTDAANALADHVSSRLSTAEPPHGPRVLLVLAETPGKLAEVLFVKRNSIHGAVLRAAGARNAVAEDVPGIPRLSIERLIALDPDAIIVLATSGGDVERAAFLGDFARVTPLSAVKTGHVSVLVAPEAFSVGPRILAFADRLTQEIARLFSAGAAQ